MARRPHIEVPTLLLGIAIYAGFAASCLAFPYLPLPIGIALGAYVVAWQGSLQHEASHGHPTPWPRVNAIFAGWSLWLYLPFSIYRDSHMEHHRSEHLTDPTLDSESYFFAEEEWRRIGPSQRWFWWLHNTLIGRMLLGPGVAIWRAYREECKQLRKNPLRLPAIWLPHAAVVALVLLAANALGVGPLEYLLCFAYPGIGLSLLRSFAEHRPGPSQSERIAVVEAGPAFSLLFLNNNLHVLHHEQPGLPWYRYRREYEKDRQGLLDRNGHLLYGGYSEIASRYLFRPVQPPVHPGVPQ